MRIELPRHPAVVVALGRERGGIVDELGSLRVARTRLSCVAEVTAATQLRAEAADRWAVKDF